MFGLFKKKSEKEKLQEKYAALMKESFDLSKSNRTLADQKYAEAMELQKQLETM
ncbi:MAG TPA: Lacal_2735 family protein [Saprospiraceae bacterium]|nr:Lacal_2735 family protein [Saprospiraceae bacterium]